MSKLLKSKFLLGVAVFALALVMTSSTALAADGAITKTLKYGMKDVQVKYLQQTLNTEGYVVATTGAGSVGSESTYFGKATLAAVKKFQTAMGLTADGVVGAKSRVALGGSPVSTTGCKPGDLFDPITGVSCTGTPVNPGNPSGPLSVQLSTDNPAPQYIIAGQAGADLAHFAFSGTGTISSVTLHRTGVSDSNTLSNVYLYDGVTRLTSGYSFNTAGDITMNNLGIVVNGSKVISVKADVYTLTNSSTVGVALTSYTAGSSATLTTVKGNDMYIGTSTLAGSNFPSATVSPAASTINAGSTNQNLWSRSLTISQHAVKLHAMTVKMIGSAPTNTLSNVALYVDGVNVATSTVNSNSQFVFALTSPLALTTGSHLVEVHGDVVGGAYRNFYLSLEQGTDLAIEDSQIPGVYVSTTSAGAVATNLIGGLVTINNGSLTINQNTAFNNTTSLVGGATNTTLASFKFTSYGEDVKVSSLSFMPTISLASATTATASQSAAGATTVNVTNAGTGYLSTPAVTVTLGTCTGALAAATATMSNGSITAVTTSGLTCAAGQTFTVAIQSPATVTPNPTLTNVGLYVNGGQVGSNQTATSGTALAFSSLGSQLLVPAGTPVIVEIKGDVVSSGFVNLTAGTVSFNLLAGSSNIQGVSSSQLNASSVASGQTLTIASSNVTFASTTGFAPSTKAPGQSGVKIGSFTVQTASAEGITVNSIAVDLAGTLVPANQLTNLTVKDESTGLIVGNQIGNPVVSGNNFSVSVDVPVSSTKVFGVYADLGSSGAGETVTPSMTITYRGKTSNLSTTSPTRAGVMTTANVATIAAAGTTFVPGSSPVAQFLIGGTTVSNIATFNIVTSNNVGGAIVKDMTFTVPANTIADVTVNGKTAQVTGTTAVVYDAGLVIPSDNSGLNFPVSVDLICAASTGCTGVSNSAVTLNLTSYTFNDGTTIHTVTPSPVATSASHVLVTTKPTLTVTQSTSGGFGNGHQLVGQFTIAADPAGDLKVEAIPVIVNVAGAGAISAGTLQLYDSTGSTVLVGTSGVNGSAGLSASGTFAFNTALRTISKGTSETYSVYADFTGVSGASGTQNVTFQLGDKSTFLWTDVAGNHAHITGSLINSYPTSSQTHTN